MERRSFVLPLLALAVGAAVLLGHGVWVSAAKSKRLDGIEDLAALLVLAGQANAAHDITLERELLERADELEGKPEDRADVERRLAALDWKYHARYDEARARLRVATEQAEPWEAWLALARLEQAAETYDAALDAARMALETADTPEDVDRAERALARAAVERSVVGRLAGKPGDDDAVSEAFELLREIVSEEPGRLEPARRLLQASLLLDRGDVALLAWRSYYHVAPGGPMPNAVEDAGHRLETLLPAWGPESERLERDRVELAGALADSRFFTEAAIIASDPAAGRSSEDSRVREVVAYAHLLRRLREVTDEYYRKTSLGRGSKSSYDRQLKREAERFFEEAGLADELDRGAPIKSLRELARERFGAMINLGRTAGYEDLHMGHIVVDERRRVEQYGHDANVRFVMLDNIVSNGFQSWAWESGAQHGGWGGSTQIVQIRPAYMSEPLLAWRLLHDADGMAEVMEEMEENTAGDMARAASDPYGYLPGLAMRLKYQGVTRLLARLTASGLEDDELRIAFVAELERVVQESSIFAHEGRHAIDAAGAAPDAPTWKKEYNAKLSEVAFAPEPRLALGGIISSNIGSDTPHGRANAKVTKGLVAWMKRNQAAIEGLDPRKPLLPQFDLLTDEQIRDAFRSMDSLAR